MKPELLTDVALAKRNRVRILLVLMCVGRVLSFGQEASRPASVQYGFQGQIHTQLAVSKELNPSPQSKVPHRLWIQDMSGWREFDPVGELLEESKVDPSGKRLQSIRYKYDAEGRATEKTVTEGEKTTHYRWESHTSTSGSIESTETVEYIDGKPSSRTHTTYDPATGESLEFDASGELLKRSMFFRRNGQTDSQLWIGNKVFVFHRVERFDEKGNLIQSLRYNAEGTPISSFSFKDGVLTSWWIDPETPCAGAATLHPNESSMVSYSTVCEGKLVDAKLLKDVRHYREHSAQFDLADEELYDSNGYLLERIEYSYEFDRHHNWNRCVVSIMDWDTKTMMPVKEFLRELTYY